jgi:hypothetical protein
VSSTSSRSWRIQDTRRAAAAAGVVDAVRRGDVEVVDGWQEDRVLLQVQPLESGLVFAEEAISSIACDDGAG